MMGMTMMMGWLNDGMNVVIIILYSMFTCE